MSTAAVAMRRSSASTCALDSWKGRAVKQQSTAPVATSPTAASGRVTARTSTRPAASRPARLATSIAVALIALSGGCGQEPDAHPPAVGAGESEDVRLTVTVAPGVVTAGGQVQLSARITNTGPRSWWWLGGDGDCRGPAIRAELDLSPGPGSREQWSGNRAVVKETALTEAVGAFGSNVGPCDDAAVPVELEPGAAVDASEMTWPAPEEEAVLPRGDAAVVVTFDIAAAPDELPGSTAVVARVPIRLDGGEEPTPAATQIVDAMLAEDSFGRWVDGLRSIELENLQFSFQDGAWKLLVASGADIGRIWADPQGKILQVHHGGTPPPDPAPGEA